METILTVTPFVMAAINVPSFPNAVSIGTFVFCMILGIVNIWLINAH